MKHCLLLLACKNTVILLDNADWIISEDQVYSNTRVPTRINTSLTRTNMSQHKSETNQHESTRAQHESRRVKKSPRWANMTQRMSEMSLTRI